MRIPVRKVKTPNLLGVTEGDFYFVVGNPVYADSRPRGVSSFVCIVVGIYNRLGTIDIEKQFMRVARIHGETVDLQIGRVCQQFPTVVKRVGCHRGVGSFVSDILPKVRDLASLFFEQSSLVEQPKQNRDRGC